MLILASSVAAQSTSTDPRAQYPALLANSYVSFNVGAVDYLFSPQQLQPGFSTGTIDTPHVTVRVALFGHEFNRFFSVQGAYMRPIQYVAYQNVSGPDVYFARPARRS